MNKRKYVTPEHKARILAEAKQDGCVLTDIAKKYQINLDTLYSWRYKESKKDQQRDTNNSTFVEVKVSPSDYRESGKGSLKRASLEFTEFTISIEGNFDMRKLEEIIQVGS